jgi:hypothetical protein
MESLNALEKIARFFNVTLDELVYMDGDLPKEVEIEDKTPMEQLQLMQELDDEKRSMIFKMMDSFLTKKKRKAISKFPFIILNTLLSSYFKMP